MRNEWRHVQEFWKIDPSRDLFMESSGMFEAFQMETRHQRKFFHRQLLRGFLERKGFSLEEKEVYVTLFRFALTW